MKVFAVTEISCSDCSTKGIHSLWSTKELAEQAKGKYERADPDLEEFEIDQIDKLNQAELFWTITMWSDGSFAQVQSRNFMEHPHEDDVPKFEHRAGITDQANHLYNQREYFRWSGLASSKEHVIQICNEKRIQYLAGQLTATEL